MLVLTVVLRVCCLGPAQAPGRERGWGGLGPVLAPAVAGFARKVGGGRAQVLTHLHGERPDVPAKDSNRALPRPRGGTS